MASYINTITNEYPLYTGDMQLIFPDFDDVIVPEGYALVPHLDAPSCTETQRIKELPPILMDGVWVKQFEVIDLTPEEIEAREQYELNLKNATTFARPSVDVSGSAPNVID